MKYRKSCDTPIGKIDIIEEAGKIIRVDIGKEEKAEEYEKDTPLLKEAGKQLMEYLNGTRREFQLPLHIEGTEFMKKVWNELIRIPYGETRTYQDIAISINHPKAARAVGMANHNNPIPIIIPCHRVVGKNGTLTGYALGLERKEWLLKLEKNDRI